MQKPLKKHVKTIKKTIKIKTGTEILNGTCLIDDDD